MCSGVTAVDTQRLNYLPSLVVSRILLYLPWQDKLSVVETLPSWEPHLCYPTSWSELQYTREQGTVHQFIQCLQKYGNYISAVCVDVRYGPGVQLQAINQILNNMATFCPHLQRVKLWDIHWDDDVMRAFGDILENCAQLRDISLRQPVLWGSVDHHSSLLAMLARPEHSEKVRELVLGGVSLDGRDRPLQSLSQFSQLRVLRVRREELSDVLLMHLSTNSLERLTLFQDTDYLGALTYSPGLWHHVLAQKPNFCVSLVLYNLTILRSMFSAQVPLITIVLVDLSTSLTKGILDTIAHNYHTTLETFVCAKDSKKDYTELNDRRLPASLIDLVRKCTRLHTLVYGFAISSATVLLIASERKLSQFVISADQLSLEIDEEQLENREPDFTNWLVTNKSSVSSLETEVSYQFGYDWTVANDEIISDLVNDYWHF